MNHKHKFKRSNDGATVETCNCGKFRFTENAGPAIGCLEANENISSTQFCDIGDSLDAARWKIIKALAYGHDMRSSRLLLLRDAAAILNSCIAEYEGR